MIDQDSYKAQMLDGLQNTWAKTIDNINQQQQTYVGNPNKENKFEPGAMVRVYDPQTSKGTVSKLGRHWRGPYRVLKIQPPIMLLTELATGRKTYIHFSRCKRLKTRPRPPLNEIQL